jgi:Ca-activated chloride channel family protein
MFTRLSVRPGIVSRRLLYLPLLAALPFLLTACGDSKTKGIAFTSIGPGVQASNTETYNHISENPFLLAAQTPLSTFSIDVDTASYSNIRRYLLQQHQLPPKDAVRIEEMLNYFDYNYPQPEGNQPVAVSTEVASCPWDSRLKLVRIGLQAKKVSMQEMPPRNLVFLLDTSGSMADANKLPLLQQALKLMIAQLRPQDRVAIVAYAGSAGLVLPSTDGNQKQTIVTALDRLRSGGSTNGGQGIHLAYQVAQQNFVAGGINRVIIGTDGDFNVGTTSDGDLVRLIEEKRQTGVYLSVLGFGMGNLKDSKMEQLAHHGNGHYAYIDSMDEAYHVFVDQGMSMFPVANDVKVQVEFNPAKVHAYRLVGYENRLLNAQDFKDEKKDAGDLGAGHAVTALYVIAPPGVQIDIPDLDPLKYQQQPNLAKAAGGPELLNVKIAYKLPGEATSKLLTQPVVDTALPFAEASRDFRFASTVAAFGMLLRDSQYKGSATYDEVSQIARDAVGPNPQGVRGEFVQMVEAARGLARKNGD